jgi:hypothetical protein
VVCRRVELERKLAADPTMSDERKQRQLQQLGKRESAFLRLRRTKLGLDDFRTVKVIGKGAFGEVSVLYELANYQLPDKFIHIGSGSAKDRYGEDLCYEDAEERGDVKERSGAWRPRVGKRHVP